jgi:hypothetical protein
MNIFLLLFSIYTLFIQNINDSTKYEMFIVAIENESTAPNYVLVTVTNLNNNQTKEICTEAAFLNGAIHRELNIGYNEKSEKKVKGILIKQRDLHFSFKNKEALKNIGFFKYDNKQLSSIGNMYNVNSIIDSVLKNDEYDFSFKGDKQTQVYLSHLILRKNIMVRRGDIAGNYLMLKLFKK